MMGSHIPWGRITNTADRIVIMGAGPSLAHVQREHVEEASKAGVRIIAVNAAVEAAPDLIDDWFTLDFDTRTRYLVTLCQPRTRLIVAVPPDFATPTARLAEHRCKLPKQDIVYLHRIEGLGTLKARTGLSNDPGTVHTGNSVWGALGVAWHMKPQRIAFLGLDASAAAGWPGGHQPQYLGHLDELFRSAIFQLRGRNIEVVNGNPNSAVACFPRFSPEEALKWIRA